MTSEQHADRMASAIIDLHRISATKSGRVYRGEDPNLIDDKINALRVAALDAAIQWKRREG